MKFLLKKTVIFLWVVLGVLLTAQAMKNNLIDNDDMIDDSHRTITTNEENDYTDYVRLCRDHRREESYGYTDLHWAAEDNDPEKIEEIFQNNKESLYATLCCGWTPLHIAVLYNNVHTARKLLELSKNYKEFPKLINRGDKNKMTPLHLAAMHNRVDMIDIFIPSGIDGEDMFALTQRGSTALYIAVERDYCHVVEKFLDYRPLDKNKYDGNALLSLADKNDNIKMIQLLVKKGPHIPLTSTYGITALHIAVNDNCMHVIKQFDSEFKTLSQKESIQVFVRNNGYGLLQMAAQYNNTDILDMLLADAGSNAPLFVHTGGLLVLHIAAECGSMDVIKFYVKKGISIVLCDSYGCNILHHAARNNQKSVLIVQDIFKIIREHMFEPENLIQELLQQNGNIFCKPMDLAQDPACKKLLTPQVVSQKNMQKNKNNQKNNKKKKK